jgi:copper transport protein
VNLHLSLNKASRKTVSSWSSRFALLFLCAVLLLGGIPPVDAHGYIVRAIPNEGTVLERAPSRVQYWFSESLEPNFSSVNVRAPSGEIVATGSVSLDDERLLGAQLPSGLPDGAYIVELRIAFASDGHVVTETQVFFVGESVEGVAGTAANNTAEPLEILWRVLLLASLLLLFGAYTLYTLVLVPAWGSTEYPAGLLPMRVMSRLNTMVTIALGVAFVANGIALMQQTMVFYGVDAAAAINNGFIQIVRTSTRFGDVWNARMVFLVMAGLLHAGSLYFRGSQPQNVRAFWSANAWLMGMVLGTLSISSHAAGSLLWTWLAVANDWLHTAAVGFWVGGVAALVLAMPPALKPYTGEARRMALLAVLRRFSRVATVCVFLVIVTGIYSALNWLYAPADLVSTSYGSTLILKVLLVGVLVLLGFAHHISLQPARYQRWAGIIRRVGSFVPTLRLEVLTAAVVLVSVGLLSATPIPKPEFLNQQADAPRETQTVGDLTITQTLSPGGPGINTYETLVLRGEQLITNANVHLQMVNPARDWRSRWNTAESAGDGLYVTAGDELNTVGTWWTLVDVTHADGTVMRAAFNWSISQDAAVPTAREATPIHWLALIGVMGVLAWAGYPYAKRFYRLMDLRTDIVVIGLAGTIGVIIFSVMGFVAIQNSQGRTEAILNPPPQIINSVLPDAASIARGQAFYETECNMWETSDALTTLRRELPTMRDEALYNATLNGWRALPACTSGLSDVQRWDIVNYLRTWEREIE